MASKQERADKKDRLSPVVAKNNESDATVGVVRYGDGRVITGSTDRLETINDLVKFIGNAGVTTSDKGTAVNFTPTSGDGRDWIKFVETYKNLIMNTSSAIEGITEDEKKYKGYQTLLGNLEKFSASGREALFELANSNEIVMEPFRTTPTQPPPPQNPTPQTQPLPTLPLPPPSTRPAPTPQTQPLPTLPLPPPSTRAVTPPVVEIPPAPAVGAPAQEVVRVAPPTAEGNIEATDPDNLGLVIATASLEGSEASAVSAELDQELAPVTGEVAQSLETGDGNLIDSAIFTFKRDDEGILRVTPKQDYAAYNQRRRTLHILSLALEKDYNNPVYQGNDDLIREEMAFFEGVDGRTLQEAYDFYNFTVNNSDNPNPEDPEFLFPDIQNAPPVELTGSDPSVIYNRPQGNSLPSGPLFDYEESEFGGVIPGQTPIGNTSLNPEEGGEEPPSGPQGAIQAPPTKFKPRYHIESIKLFFGDDKNPPWDLQLERSISELTWGKEGFNKAMNGLIEKHSTDFFIWERKSDGTREEFNEICQVYFCFLRQLQRGNRSPTANVPLSSLLGFGNKLAQAAGGLGDATFSNTAGGGMGDGRNDTTGTGGRAPYGPFQGVSPYRPPPGQKGGTPYGPFSGATPYEVGKGKQSNKSLRGMIKTAAEMQAEKLIRVPQNEAITAVVDAFDKRPMNWANKPLANEYIIEAAAKLPKGNIEGKGNPKDPTDAFQYGTATKAALRFNIKPRKPQAVRTVRNV